MGIEYDDSNPASSAPSPLPTAMPDLPAAPSGSALIVQYASSGANITISPARRAVARDAVALAVLHYLAGAFMIAGTILILANFSRSPFLRRTDLRALLVTGVLIGLFNWGFATTYLICRKKIKTGGTASLIVMLVLAIVSLVAAIILDVGMLLTGRPVLAALFVYGIATVAYAAFIYHLAKALREPAFGE